MLQEQGLGNDGVNTAGARELGQGDDQLNREEKQVTHRHERLPGAPGSARLLQMGGSGYDSGIRTPQAADHRLDRPFFFEKGAQGNVPPLLPSRRRPASTHCIR